MRRWTIVFVTFFLVLGTLYWKFDPNRPVDYADVEEHFKYGSIGSDNLFNGIPYWVWKVLPDMFPDKLPGKGYASLGFIEEGDHHNGARHGRPIGFSMRRSGIDLVGLNCAVCHTGTLRERPESLPRVYVGMPANTVDLQGYFEFLSSVAQDPNFTTQNVMLAIKEHGADLNVVENFIYRYIAIPRMREGLIQRGGLLAFLGHRPRLGPGRVDTFNPYKTLLFGFPAIAMSKESIGTADFPSIWNQGIRENMPAHWDGNNTSVAERNKSAALGAGVVPFTMDHYRIRRIEEWLYKLPPPEYPFPIDRRMAQAGRPIYQRHCGSCHDANGSEIGRIAPIEEIGTDRERLDSFSHSLVSNMNTVGAGYEWRFRHFRKTHGYVNMPLDGVWLRAPYLHNGSVPTMADLFRKPEERPIVFYRGNDVYDQEHLGFVSTASTDGTRKFFHFDTREKGNHNTGHDYGTDLSEKDKAALIEYLKTL
jgi:hypothetical protein